MSFRYVLTLLLLAAATSGTGILLWPIIGWPAGVFLYAALSFLLLAVAYAGLGPRLLCKRPDGRLSFMSWFLFGPYHLLNSLTFWLYRRASREPAQAQIVPGLHFGRRLTAQEAEALAPSGVLDLAAEFAEVGPLRRVAAYRSLPVLDAMAPAEDDLRSAVAWLRERTRDGPVYVHCALGHGRTATVVVAYLLVVGEVKSAKEGLARLRNLRPGVGLHPPQRELLRHFEPGG